MLRTLIIMNLATCLIGTSANAQMATEKPIIRDNECLATYNTVYVGLEWIPVSEYLSRYWSEQIHTSSTIYSQTSREKTKKDAQVKLEESKNVEYTYQVFRKTNTEKLTIFIEFFDGDGYTGKKVTLNSKQGSENIIHRGVYEGTLNFSYTQIVEITWLQNEFTFQLSGVSFSDDEITNVYTGGKWKGTLDCSN